MAKKTALITGITGQDGSYLAELLLDQGYRVVGMTRRSSTDVHERIEHIVDRVEIVSGDLLDQSSMTNLLAQLRPDEVYNLAAQSFVPTSWTQPVLTGEFTALGVTRVLEAIRAIDTRIRFYQASSSEMFGKVTETPQSERTPFYPRSPYGVAKVYGHWITVNYRESYNLFATSGMLFNHESTIAKTPLIIRRKKYIDVVTIDDVVHVQEKGPRRQEHVIEDLEVWDGEDFVHATRGSAYKHRPVVDNKGVRRIEARCGSVTTTADHLVFLHECESAAAQVNPGDKMKLGAFPPAPSYTSITAEMAWLLGAFVGDGSACVLKNGHVTGRFVNGDAALRQRFADAWNRTTCGWTKYVETASGFVPGRVVGNLALSGAPDFVRWLRTECYTKEGYKRVPKVVLNADETTWRAFLEGYNAADGLKAGHGAYRYKNFKTNSPVLAMGLWWMSTVALKRDLILNVEVGPPERPGPFYSINLRSPNPVGGKGAHLRRDRQEVKRIVEFPHYEGWLYDLTTTSGKFAAGVGQCVVHNSPRRGKEFVTRKISDGVARIKLGLASELRLGNLDAQRDWGFAGDYVRAMWLMLQQEKPDDFVIATGRTHSVRDFVRLAFAAVDLDYEKYVVLDQRLVRPAEVDLLIGDPSKARRVLGWEPTVTFEELVDTMVRADLERLRPLARGVTPVRALVTGGNGFVGRHVVRALLERGDEVVIAGRADGGGGVDVPLDLSDADNVRGAVALARADVVFHLAAQAFVPEATRAPIETYATNAMGTAYLLEAVRSAGKPFSRVVIASSAEVYGPRDPAEYPLRETLAPRPATPYAASKLAAEAMALAAWRTYRIPALVTRGFNAIGPGQDERFVVAAFAKQLASVAAGETQEILVGNLAAKRDFLDVRDVAEAYVVLAGGGESGEVYNVCRGTPLAIRDVLAQLIAAAGIAVEVREDPERMRPSDVPLSYGDPSKLQRATGWSPRVLIATLLRDAYDDAVARRAAA